MYHSCMNWVNYHHLMYFWTVAREGTIAKACEELHLGQPAISTQLKQLEAALGVKLFRSPAVSSKRRWAGRSIAMPTRFSLGSEMLDAIRGRPTGKPLRFAVGIVDSVQMIAKVCWSRL